MTRLRICGSCSLTALNATYSAFIPVMTSKCSQPTACALMGTKHRLCLQIEWHRARSRQTGGVLGSRRFDVCVQRASPSSSFICIRGMGMLIPYKRHFANKTTGIALRLLANETPILILFIRNGGSR